MKIIINILILINLLLVISCSKKEFDYDLINEIDNELVYRNFDLEYINSIYNEYEENDYLVSLYGITNIKNGFIDTSTKSRIIEIDYSGTFTYSFLGIRRYITQKVVLRKSDDSSYYFHNKYLNKKINVVYSFGIDHFKESYRLDKNNQNIWVRIGLSYVLTDNGYYKDAIDYLFEAEAINPENLYVKELILKNFLLAKDTIYAREYLSQIPQDYKFNDIEDNVRDILKNKSIGLLLQKNGNKK